MTSNSRHHESGPWVRFALIVLLAAMAYFDDVLTLETLRTSAVAMVYAASLGLMLAASLRSLGEARRDGQPSGSFQPRPEPAWEVHNAFTDPLFQGPAVFCVFVLALDLVSDLKAQPPTSIQAMWFLVTMSFLAVVLLLEPFWKAGEKAGASRLAYGQLQAAPPRQEKAADPWFSIPHVGLGFVIFTRLGVLQIEENPTSVATWALLLAVPAVGAFTAVSSALQRQRRVRSQDT